MSTTPARTTRSRLWPLAADLACVVALAVGGMSSHDGNETDWIVLRIAWPYAVAGGLAHLALASRRRQPQRLWPDGVGILAVTYGVGMVLRGVSGRGLDPAFLVVAGLFLTATMLGWRVLAHLAARRSAEGPA